jgi:hypothetical protein
MTTLMTDYGGTTPASTSAAIAESASDLHRAFGPEHVLAVCEEFRNVRLLDYEILVVYDVVLEDVARPAA